MGTCIFCGSEGQLTEEHVLPQRLNGIVPFPPDDHVERMIMIRPGRTLATAERRQFAQPAFKRTARCVCEPCNHDWMSDLDEEAEHVYAPMMLGKSFRIRPGAQRSLAWWLAKIAAVMEYADVHSPGMSADQHRWIMKEKSPPPGMKIWIADFDLPADASYRYEHTTWCFAPAVPDLLTGGWARPRGAAGDTNSHFSMIVIGRLAAMLLGTSSPLGLGPLEDAPTKLSASLAQLWPLRTKYLAWPPGPPLPQDGLPEFGEGLEDGLF
jgi:hypothetical protein